MGGAITLWPIVEIGASPPPPSPPALLQHWHQHLHRCQCLLLRQKIVCCLLPAVCFECLHYASTAPAGRLPCLCCTCVLFPLQIPYAHVAAFPHWFRAVARLCKFIVCDCHPDLDSSPTAYNKWVLFLQTRAPTHGSATADHHVVDIQPDLHGPVKVARGQGFIRARPEDVLHMLIAVERRPDWDDLCDYASQVCVLLLC